jgi:hypothetical protein
MRTDLAEIDFIDEKTKKYFFRGGALIKDLLNLQPARLNKHIKKSIKV